MTFEEVYEKYYWMVEQKATRYSYVSGESKEDLISFLTEQIWLAWKDYDRQVGKMSIKSFLDVRLTQRMTDYMRNRQLEFERSIPRFTDIQEYDDDGEPIPLEFIDERQLKEKAVDNQRQLIIDLLKETDSITTAIVKEYLTDDNPRPTTIGKRLGLHHQTVRRKLNALAKNYHNEIPVEEYFKHAI